MTQDKARFAEGPAIAVGLAITSTGRGDADDAVRSNNSTDDQSVVILPPA